MKALLFCLISAGALAAHGAAINFKDIALTNVVKTNDLVLVDSALGGTNYATRTAPVLLITGTQTLQYNITNYFTWITNYFDYSVVSFTNATTVYNTSSNYYTNVLNHYFSTTNIIDASVANVKNSTVIFTNASLTKSDWLPLRVLGTDSGTNAVSLPIAASTNGNLGALLAAGPTNYVDFSFASATNSLTENIEFYFATNGVESQEWTHVRTLYNGSGGNLTVTLPATWHSVNGATVTVTNATVVSLYVTARGATANAATQTNVFSRAEYYP